MTETTNFYNWSQLYDTTNGASDVNINWQENQDPSTVNNSARVMMARSAQYRDDVAADLLGLRFDALLEQAAGQLLLRLAGKDQNTKLGQRIAQSVQDLDAGDARKQDVEDDEVVLLRQAEGERLLPVVADVDAVSLLLQPPGDAVGQMPFVLEAAVSAFGGGVFASLADETRVYPGHDYLKRNLAFTLSIEPGNAAAGALASALESTDGTAPHFTTIGEERAINLFLRTGSHEVRTNLELPAPANDSDVFLAIRKRRDHW